MKSKYYNTKTGFAFVPPHNPGNYPQSMGNSQEQAPGTEIIRQNQALFRKYTAVSVAFKNQIIAAVIPILLYPLV